MSLSSASFPGELAPESPAAKAASVLARGLPAFRRCIRAAAALVFSAVWMAQGWRGAKPLLGPTKINYLTQDFWGLLVTLTCCYAVGQFFRQRSQATGHALTLAIAAVTMSVRSF